MTPQQSELLTRIEAFAFDLPDTKFTFAKRLARENGWSAGMSQRVLREYRRFVFLAMTAGHPVCPSEAVDQAWHQHLTFTQNYWEDFCGQVLGKPLHHGPTRGGSSEAMKHHEMYERTLASYREYFGHDAPPDLWPPAQVRFGEGGDYVRVNRRKVWVLPKPRWLRQAALAVLALTMLLGFAGCLNLASRTAEVTSGETLSVVGMMILVGTLLFAAVPRGQGNARASAADLPTDPYLVATLTGGSTLAIYSALAELTRLGKVVVEGPASIALHRLAIPPTQLHPFERAIYDQLSAEPITLETLRSRVAVECAGLRRVLEARGLVYPEAVRAHQPASVALWFGLAVGIFALLIGSGRFTTILVILVIVAAIGLKMLRRSPYRTRRGNQIQDMLGQRYPRADYEYRSISHRDAAPGLLPMGVALYGLPILAGASLTAFAWQDFTPPMERRPAAEGSAGGSGCSSGCGSSPDSSTHSGCGTGDNGSSSSSGDSSSGGDSSGGGSSDGGSSGCSSASSGCSSGCGGGGCGGGGGGD